MTNAPVKTGLVKFVDRGKGYGYIIPAEATSPRDTVLFERADVEDFWGIYAGQRVQYTLAQGLKRARHVRQVTTEENENG